MNFNIHIMQWRFDPRNSTISWIRVRISSRPNINILSFYFILYFTLEIRHSLQTHRFVEVRISSRPSIDIPFFVLYNIFYIGNLSLEFNNEWNESFHFLPYGTYIFCIYIQW
uniref:hypothetical protein n=1 Tax=Malassezia arunalokei TaxID=1514897 RepID=UPI00300309E7|nr:hypothetical protein [Malassezia arunalokei]